MAIQIRTTLDEPETGVSFIPHRPSRPEKAEGGKRFELVTDYTASGDQPAAIRELTAAARAGDKDQVLLGVTGSGKTFTMNGSTPNYKYRGIIPRAINQIYQEVGRHADQDFAIKVSYLEIYNEQIYDLLSDEARDSPFGGSQISIQDDAKRLEINCYAHLMNTDSAVCRTSRGICGTKLVQNRHMNGIHLLGFSWH